MLSLHPETVNQKLFIPDILCAAAFLFFRASSGGLVDSQIPHSFPNCSCLLVIHPVFADGCYYVLDIKSKWTRKQKKTGRFIFRFVMLLKKSSWLELHRVKRMYSELGNPLMPP